MINKEELISFVNSRSWYQTIKFEEDVISKGCEWCGEPAWENMATLLPTSFENMRVLDLGCNAGLFCVKAALMGAKEVIGIDYPGWRPKWDFIEQQNFVKSYFEQKYNTVLPITYIPGKMEEILWTKDLGTFDYTFAIASIYYTDTPKDTVQRISQLSDNVIVRLRDKERIDLFTDLFKDSGYRENNVIHEKMWEKLGRNTDDFYMYLYTK